MEERWTEVDDCAKEKREQQFNRQVAIIFRTNNTPLLEDGV
jgi:hypothetical protein